MNLEGKFQIKIFIFYNVLICLFSKLLENLTYFKKAVDFNIKSSYATTVWGPKIDPHPIFLKYFLNIMNER